MSAGGYGGDRGVSYIVPSTKRKINIFLSNLLREGCENDGETRRCWHSREKLMPSQRRCVALWENKFVEYRRQSLSNESSFSLIKYWWETFCTRNGVHRKAGKWISHFTRPAFVRAAGWTALGTLCVRKGCEGSTWRRIHMRAFVARTFSWSAPLKPRVRKGRLSDDRWCASVGSGF